MSCKKKILKSFRKRKYFQNSIIFFYIKSQKCWVPGIRKKIIWPINPFHSLISILTSTGFFSSCYQLECCKMLFAQFKQGQIYNKDKLSIGAKQLTIEGGNTNIKQWAEKVCPLNRLFLFSRVFLSLILKIVFLY